MFGKSLGTPEYVNRGYVRIFQKEKNTEICEEVKVKEKLIIRIDENQKIFPDDENEKKGFIIEWDVEEKNNGLDIRDDVHKIPKEHLPTNEIRKIKGAYDDDNDGKHTIELEFIYVIVKDYR